MYRSSFVRKRVIQLCMIAMVLAALPTGLFAAGTQEEAAPKDFYRMSVLIPMSINPNTRTRDENAIGESIKEKLGVVFDYTPIVGNWMDRVNLVLCYHRSIIDPLRRSETDPPWRGLSIGRVTHRVTGILH